MGDLHIIVDLGILGVDVPNNESISKILCRHWPGSGQSWFMIETKAKGEVSYGLLWAIASSTLRYHAVYLVEGAVCTGHSMIQNVATHFSIPTGLTRL